MVNEREPPRLPTSGQPQFGSSSPLRNPLHSNRPNIFNIPRPGPRPEHHKPKPTPPTLIQAPSNEHVNAIRAAPSPLFSTSFNPINGYRHPAPNVMPVSDHTPQLNPYDPSNFLSAAQTNENIKALLDGAIDDDEPPQSEGKDDGSVEGLTVRLLPHQIEGVAWMLDKEIGTRKKNGVLPKGGILADDMGLGKTIQALALILSNRQTENEKATLIVAPLALIKQWESEIKDKVKLRLKVLVHHGPSRTRSSEELKKHDIVITTYQTLTSEHAESTGCMGVPWFRVILDEAHSIKNRSAKMTKAVYELQSTFRWCLTGTPMQNNLDELQSLIHFLRIKPYCELSSWREQIAKPMKNGRGGLAIKRLQYFLKAFMKRRTKDILKKDGALNFGKTSESSEGFKIVGRQVNTVNIDFSPAEREFYSRLERRTQKSLDAMLETRNDYIGALVLLLRLRQACNHPDLIKGSLVNDKDIVQKAEPTPRRDDVDDIADLFGSLSVISKKCDGCGAKLMADTIRCKDCEEAMNVFHKADEDAEAVSSAKIRKLCQILEEESDQHKFIVFSEFTSMLDLIEPFLKDAGYRYARYDGSMRNDQREASLERLRNEPRVRILLCSLKCGALGLNLTAASRVIIMEPFWNPFVEEQAIDRVHRINQTKDVVVYRLTVGGTVETRIFALQDRKRQLAKAALEGGKAVGKLSMEDILSLFRREAEYDPRHDTDVFKPETIVQRQLQARPESHKYTIPKSTQPQQRNDVWSRRD